MIKFQNKENIYVSVKYDTYKQYPYPLSIGMYNRKSSYYSEFTDYNPLYADPFNFQNFCFFRKLIRKQTPYNDFDTKNNLFLSKSFYLKNSEYNNSNNAQNSMINYLKRFNEINFIYEYNPYDITTILNLYNGMINYPEHNYNFISLKQLSNANGINYYPITEKININKNKFLKEYNGTSIYHAYNLFLLNNKLKIFL